jgi:hypothetical protein
VTCLVVRVTNNYGIRRTIGFINTSVTLALLITVTSKQYSAIVDLHQLPLLTHWGFFCFPLVVSEQRLSTHNYNSLTLQLLHTLKVFYSQKHSLQFTIQFFIFANNLRGCLLPVTVEYCHCIPIPRTLYSKCHYNSLITAIEDSYKPLDLTYGRTLPIVVSLLGVTSLLARLRDSSPSRVIQGVYSGCLATGGEAIRRE